MEEPKVEVTGNLVVVVVVVVRSTSYRYMENCVLIQSTYESTTRVWSARRAWWSGRIWPRGLLLSTEWASTRR